MLDVDAETQTQAFDNLYIGNWMILKYQIGTRKLKQKTLLEKIIWVSLLQLPDGAILATLDVCSLNSNILQEEGIEVVCQYYQEHYQWKTPIANQSLGDLMRLIL